ncbi:MAG: thermonuclease family protein [Ramlibacter sp.]
MTVITRLARGAVLAASLLALPLHAATFHGVVTHVTDGDSLWVRPVSGGAPRELRLRDIDAPEICQAFGEQSRNALAARVLHRQVSVRSRARDNYQRALAEVSLGGEDLAAWMVGRGYAWSYRYRGKGGPYQAQEEQARSARLGLWASDRPVEPRLFRKRHGRCK